MSRFRFLIGLSGFLITACYGPEEDFGSAVVDNGEYATFDGGEQVDTPDAGSAVISENAGFSCDVKNLVQTKCVSCHGTNPSGGASFSLVSMEDFTRPSSVSGETMARRSLARMLSTINPMPPFPGAPATASELTAFESWVNAGFPAESCGGENNGGIVDPYAVASVCTTGTYWTRGENTNMRPGEACISCHTREGEGPRYKFAGTVYPTAHEPNRCDSKTFSGLQIVIIDKNGVSHNLSQFGSKGNFGTTTAFATPYTAKLVYQGRERVMTTAQTNGDCNLCHTQNGTQGAPGRLLLP